MKLTGMKILKIESQHKSCSYKKYYCLFQSVEVVGFKAQPILNSQTEPADSWRSANEHGNQKLGFSEQIFNYLNLYVSKKL